jgi:hypothetical protein
MDEEKFKEVARGLWEAFNKGFKRYTIYGIPCIMHENFFMSIRQKEEACFDHWCIPKLEMHIELGKN